MNTDSIIPFLLFHITYNMKSIQKKTLTLILFIYV